MKEEDSGGQKRVIERFEASDQRHCKRWSCQGTVDRSMGRKGDAVEYTAESPVKDRTSYLKTRITAAGRLVLPRWTQERDKRLQKHLRERRKLSEEASRRLKEREKPLDLAIARAHERAQSRTRTRNRRDQEDTTILRSASKTNDRLAERARSRRTTALHDPPERIVAAHTNEQLEESGFSVSKMPYSDMQMSHAYLELEDAVRNGTEADVRQKAANAKKLGVISPRAECFLKLKRSMNAADRVGCLDDPEAELPELEREIRRAYLVQLSSNVVQRAKKRVEIERALQGGDVRSMEIFLQQTKRAGIDISVYRRKVAQAKVDARVEQLEAKVALRNSGSPRVSASAVIGSTSVPKRMLQMERRDLRPLGEAVKEGDAIEGVDTTAGHAVLKVADASIRRDVELILFQLETAAFMLKEHSVAASKLEVVKAAYSLLNERADAVTHLISRGGTIEPRALSLLMYIESLSGQHKSSNLVGTLVDDLRFQQAEHGIHSPQALSRSQSLRELYSTTSLMQQRYQMAQDSVLMCIDAGLLADPDEVRNPGLESAASVALTSGIDQEMPELIAKELRKSFGTDTSWRTASPEFNHLPGDLWSEYVACREQFEAEMIQSVATRSFTKAAEMASEIDSQHQLKDLFLPGRSMQGCNLRIFVNMSACTVGKVLGFESNGNDLVASTRRSIAKAVKPTDDKEVPPFDAGIDERSVVLSSLSNPMAGSTTATFDVNVMDLSETHRGFDEIDPKEVVTAFRDSVRSIELEELGKMSGGHATVQEIQERVWYRTSLTNLLNTVLRDCDKPLHNQHEGGRSQVLLPRLFEISKWDNIELLAQCIRKLMPHWPAASEPESEWALLDEGVRRLRQHVRVQFKSCVQSDLDSGKHYWTETARLVLERLGIDDFEAVMSYMHLEAIEMGKATSLGGYSSNQELRENFSKQWRLLGVGRMLRERTHRMLLNGYSSVEQHKIEKTMSDVGEDINSHWEEAIAESFQAAVHAMNKAEFKAALECARNKKTVVRDRVYDRANESVESLLNGAVKHGDADTAVHLLTEVLEAHLPEENLGDKLCNTLTAHMLQYCHWALFYTAYKRALQPLLETFSSHLETHLLTMVEATAATSYDGGERLRFSLNAGADLLQGQEQTGFKMPESTKSVMRETLERSKLLRGLDRAQEVLNGLDVPQQLLDEADEWRLMISERKIHIPQHELRVMPNLEAAQMTLDDLHRYGEDEVDERHSAWAAQHQLFLHHYTWLVTGKEKNAEELNPAKSTQRGSEEAAEQEQHDEDDRADSMVPGLQPSGSKWNTDNSAALSSSDVPRTPSQTPETQQTWSYSQSQPQQQQEEQKDHVDIPETELYLIFNTAYGTDAALALQTQLKLMVASGSLQLSGVPEQVVQSKGVRVKHSQAGEWSYLDVERQIRGAKGVAVLLSRSLLRSARTLFEIRCAIRHHKRITLIHHAEKEADTFAEVEHVLSFGPADARLYLGRLSAKPLRNGVADAASVCRHIIEDLQLR